MEEIKHTPGPWYPVCYAGYWEVVDGPYYENAQLLNEDDYPNAEANAKLAAAAPELLEACLVALDNLSNGEAKSKYRYTTVLDSLKTAIQKATD